MNIFSVTMRAQRRTVADRVNWELSYFATVLHGQRVSEANAGKQGKGEDMETKCVCITLKYV